MFRYLLATLVLAATLSFSGCVLGPCGGGQCNDCDGASAHGRILGGGPGQSFRNWRKGLTCGSGCGEVYYDEWSSTPPDCVDPCPDFGNGGCGGGCGGGCNDCSPCGCGVLGCRGGCGFRPLRAVKRIVVGLYGKRHCGDCGHGVDACSCDDPYSGYSGGACCDGCASDGGGGGCATGNCGVMSSGTTQVVNNERHSMARQQMLTRGAMNRATANSQGQVRTAQNQSSMSNAAPQKFYRQSTQQPRTNRALRR